MSLPDRVAHHVEECRGEIELALELMDRAVHVEPPTIESEGSYWYWRGRRDAFESTVYDLTISDEEWRRQHLIDET